MTVAETSKDAYKELKESGQDITDKERCKLIIEEYGPITMEDMEMHMGKTKSAFSGRIRELKDEDVVEVAGREDGHQLLDIKEQQEGLRPSCSECGRQYEVLGVAMSCCEDVEQETEEDELEAGDVIWG